MCVRWKNECSSMFSVLNGVRQGGILSPLLFNVYMDKLSSKLNVTQAGCSIGNVTINHLMYADDIVLFAPSVKGLQRLLNICNEYGTQHSIIFNKTKSVCMHIKSRRLKWSGGSPKAQLGGEALSFVDECTYLGHFICSNLSDNSDINRTIRSLYCRANTLLRKFNLCSKATKYFLFQMYCSNMYCSSLWCSYSQSTYKRVHVAYNNALRILLKMPSSVVQVKCL